MKVPQLNPNLKRNRSGLGMATDPRSARSSGEALGQLGQAAFQLGGTLAKLKGSQDKAQAELAKSEYKRAFKERSLELEQNIAKAGNGSTNLEDYRKHIALTEKGLLKEIGAKYGNQFTSQLSTISNNLVDSRADIVSVEAIKQQKDFLQEAHLQLNSDILSQVNVNPDDLAEYISDYDSNNVALFEQYGMLPDNPTVIKANREGARKLVEQATEGYMRQGRFAEAESVAIGYGHLFDQEENQKRMTRIEEHQFKTEQRELSAMDRQRKEEERGILKEQEANYFDFIQALQQAEQEGDFALLTQLETSYQESFANNSINKAQLSHLGMLNERTLKRESAHSNYFKLGREFYNINTPVDLSAFETKVFEAAQAKRITSEDALMWQSRIKAMKDTMTKDPDRHRLIKIHQDRLRAYTTPPDMFELAFGKLNPTQIRERIQKETFLINDFQQLVYFENIEPDVAFAIAIDRHFPGVGAIEIVPGYHEALSTPESQSRYALYLKEFTQDGSNERREGLRRLQEAQKRTNEQIIRDSIPETIRKRQEQITQDAEHKKSIERLDAAQNTLNELFRLDDIMPTPARREIPFRP